VFTRVISAPAASFFLFGPRGTGKSTWLRTQFPDALFFDLLESETYVELLASPQRLDKRIPTGFKGRVVIDEVQKIPEILDEVHRLIERRKLKFALTGSSARKLRRGGVNLLAGRARSLAMHPLTCEELGDSFDLRTALDLGMLPTVHTTDPDDARSYLRGYVGTYLREEVQHEGLTRNLSAFARFLEVATLSQAQPLNISGVGRDCGVDRKVVEDYFRIVEDLLIGFRLPPFTRRAKRRLTQHPKFFFFDAGVYRALRPRGPLDSAEEIDGAAMETLVVQEVRAVNDLRNLEYSLHHWRSANGQEVDLVLYGPRGLHAIEVKRTSMVRGRDLAGLEAFLSDYPMARACVVYGGERAYHEGKIEIVPAPAFFRGVASRLE
jgi:uncharacterized protein